MTDPKKPPDPATGDAMYLASERLRSRYGGKSHMWIKRQLGRDPSFPRPDFYIGGKRFWRVAKLEAWEATLPSEPPKWLALRERAGHGGSKGEGQEGAEGRGLRLSPSHRCGVAGRERHLATRRAAEPAA